MRSIFLAESVSELCVLADVKRTLNTNAAKDNVTAYTTMYSKFLRFFLFSSRNETGPTFSSPASSTPAFSVLHFPVLHFPPRIFGPPFSSPALSVLHFPVLHFSTREIWSYIFQSCRSLFDLSGPTLVPHFPVLHFQSTQRAFMCTYSDRMEDEKVTWMRSSQHKNDLTVPTK